jgi:capsid protein
VQLGFIEQLYVNAQAFHKVKITKRASWRRIKQSVLAMLTGRRLSLGEASHRLSPKSSLLESVVRTYMVCHA